MLEIIKYLLIITISLILLSCSNNTSNLCLNNESELAEFVPTENIVMFGEIHGNNESPEYFFHSICKQLLSSNKSLIVGLEMPQDLQTNVESFIQSTGINEDKEKLLKHRFWNKVSHDGRSSLAMFDLLDKLRAIKNSYSDQLSIVLLDGKIDAFINEYTVGDRNEIMGKNIQLLSTQSPEAKVFTLTGNYHTRKYPTESMPHLVTTAMYVDAPKQTINLLPTGGKSWHCTPCEPKNNYVFTQILLDSTPKISFSETGPWDVTILIGPTTASPPAVTPLPGITLLNQL